MAFFSIGGFNSERLEINLTGSPARTKSKGEDWVTAKVKVDIGAFKGELQISIWLSDVISFKEQLDLVYRDLKGVAEFTTIEDQLFIRIELDRLGHVLASGYLVDDFDRGNKLSFNIQYDQTLLHHTISEIDELLFEFSPDQPPR
jgi:hypothetical protein